MSNLAVKIQQQRQEQQSQQQVQQQTVVIRKNRSITLGEKFLFVLFIAGVVLAAVSMISNSVAAYQTNVEIQKLEQKLELQQKTNSDLQVEVKELSNYDRIWTKAKEMGLTLEKNNVKVIQE
ncbi:cell division protein FtsL [Bacillus lacus]|uniref:Cell division protein FtsL n=1 Tax=Metabacillus lacus TaxID=1983721 RepID=A0A7X2IVZ8_9BACI|nr:cell division protein FtsL [Metabacillus lacus]MRX70816.1 cell division protein FtsL [Metabacillus lacus]